MAKLFALLYPPRQNNVLGYVTAVIGGTTMLLNTFLTYVFNIFNIKYLIRNGVWLDYRTNKNNDFVFYRACCYFYK